MITKEELVLRGEAAKRLLSEPLIQEALAGIKKEIIEQWTATPARDVEGREWVWRHYKVAEKFEAMLKGYVEIGRLEKFNLEQEKPGIVDWFKRKTN